MEIRTLVNILGNLLCILGATLLVPAVFSSFDGGNHTAVLFAAAMAASLAGAVVAYSSRAGRPPGVSTRTAFAAVTFSWLEATIVGAFPYYFSGTLSSFVDCLFESASGFSGTGASVLVNIEGVDRALLLWRSMTQWLGGMGIIMFFIAILPLLGIGGVQLFRAESPGPQKDKITPRVTQTAQTLWLLYVTYTLLLVLALHSVGMDLFDSFNHAMTTLSTGGFSTKNAGVAAFSNYKVDYILSAFMLLASVNFSLHYRLLWRKAPRIWTDTELKTYLVLIALAVIFCTLLSFGTVYDSLEKAFRLGLFEVLSTVSSTGFTHADYLAWPVFLHFILILLMIMGGMSGSTAGGMKVIRVAAAYKLLVKELKQIIHPSAVLTVKANNLTIQEHIASAIWGFLFTYATVSIVVSAVLVFQGLDLVSSLTATISALSNIGPAFGELGPYDSYSFLPQTSKLFLTAGMIMGRLEFFTVLVLFMPAYWRK